jgi:predicted SAM-dependent methyltransferase
MLSELKRSNLIAKGTERKAMRVNIGCGSTPTPGWLNFDNSLSVRLARIPMVALLRGRGDGLTSRFVAVAREEGIQWADATKKIPLEANSVEVIYSSHMVEHLDPEEVRTFLKEAHRVLTPRGILRIAVPDVGKLVSNYLTTGDADELVAQTFLAARKPKTLLEKLKYLVVGSRHHHWMYDGASLSRLLASMGFIDAKVLNAGTTGILAPGDLDLYERHEESIFVEALKPELT